MERIRGRTAVISGTAVLSALVVVFDYSLKYSGLKIPFPWLPVLKFDFTGIPIVLSLFLYGLSSGLTASLVAFLGILLRSGDFIGSSMKALAEFSTILGIALLPKRSSKLRKTASFALGLILRVLITSLANLVVFPMFYRTPFTAALLLLPLIAVFNVAQGSISIFIGYFINEALKKRIPSLVKDIEQN